MYKVALAYPHTIASNHLLFRGINEYAQAHPIFEFRYFANNSEAGLKELIEWNGDGAIVSLDSERAIQLVKGANLAMVNVSNAVDDNTVPRVYRDHTEIGTKAAEYLANLGVHELAFVGIANRHYSQMKWQALEAKAQVLAKPAIPFFIESTSELLTEEKMIRDFIYWLKSLQPPVGLLLDEDALYNFVYQVCKRCNLRIPEDIAIISVNNSQSCLYQKVPLTSFLHNNKDYGTKVMQTLHALIEKRAAPEDLDIAIQGVELHERESSNILHCKDARLSTTIKYIKANLNRTFTIEELLQEVGCSRRTIENLIKSERGCTLHDYIIQEKVKSVKQVFKSNGYIEPFRLASLTGFSSSRHLQNVFKRIVGCSLEEYALQKSVF